MTAGLICRIIGVLGIVAGYILLLVKVNIKEHALNDLSLANGKLRREIQDIKIDRDILYNQLAAVSEYVDSTPTECKPGAYCGGCIFAVRSYSITRGEFIVCGKGGICPSFTPGERDETDV